VDIISEKKEMTRFRGAALSRVGETNGEKKVPEFESGKELYAFKLWERLFPERGETPPCRGARFEKEQNRGRVLGGGLITKERTFSRKKGSPCGVLLFRRGEG